MKQALKQSLANLLKTTLPTGISISLVVYMLRWIFFFNNTYSFMEEASLVLLIVSAVCCSTYTVLFLMKTINHVQNPAYRNS